MVSFTEAQILAWVTPLLWPFLRVLALLSVLPVLGQRMVPTRVRIGIAAFVALAVQGVEPVPPVVPLDSAEAVLIVAQQLVIGLTIGFSVRVLFAAIEFAGEVVGLQMGLNFAGFFDPVLASQSTATQRLFGTLVAFLFVVINGHLTVIAAVAESLQAFPVAPEPLGMLRTLAPQTWGAEIFRLGLWVALPLLVMLLFVNIVLGVISRVAPQMNVFAIGFPITLGLGLIGLAFTLPMMQGPFVMALERMLALFR